jgi:site-specific DNA-methyltransferase (adenine-specific)
MRWLVKLITPKHGIVLDPFAGSGTTCIAAKLELINYIGIELDKENCEIAEARIAAWNPEKYIEQKLFDD